MCIASRINIVAVPRIRLCIERTILMSLILGMKILIHIFFRWSYRISLFVMNFNGSFEFWSLPCNIFVRGGNLFLDLGEKGRVLLEFWLGGGQSLVAACFKDVWLSGSIAYYTYTHLSPTYFDAYKSIHKIMLNYVITGFKENYVTIDDKTLMSVI